MTKAKTYNAGGQSRHPTSFLSWEHGVLTAQARLDHAERTLAQATLYGSLYERESRARIVKRYRQELSEAIRIAHNAALRNERLR